MQLLIFYLSNNNVKKNDNISNIINNAPSYLKITNDCIAFFNNEGKQFNLDKLMNIFFFIEHLCFNDLIEALQPEYKCEIKKDIIEKIKEKLLKHRNDIEIYTIRDLAAAVRRFISRYLVGKRQTIDIDEKRDLAFELSRNDLWNEKIGKIENLDNLISNKIGEFNLKVGQAYAFYQIIANEDKIDFNFDENNNNILNQNNINNNIIDNDNNSNIIININDYNNEENLYPFI